MLRQGELTTAEVAEGSGVGERTAQRLLPTARSQPGTCGADPGEGDTGWIDTARTTAQAPLGRIAVELSQG
ncbi:hypothetical protein [Streptomyces lavendulae]|uniref:hypothetical protein n=1 Tax=Streptomyces lavendulae TaxID=1914 RepID=UPI0033DD73BE